MSEVKFQAWDESHQQMCDVYGIEYGNGNNGKIGEILSVEVGVFIGDLTEPTPVSVDIAFIKLRRYTGLKDKNGIEIYERDIVSEYLMTASIGGLPKAIGEVKRQLDGRYVIEPVDSWKGTRLFVGIDKKYEKGRLEVIGNIYENPELVEKKS